MQENTHLINCSSIVNYGYIAIRTNVWVLITWAVPGGEIVCGAAMVMVGLIRGMWKGEGVPGRGAVRDEVEVEAEAVGEGVVAKYTITVINVMLLLR